MADSITADSLLSHTLVLASDDYEGRFPGTDGETKTINYLTQEFKKIDNIHPFGNAVHESWTQPVPLAKITPTKFGNMTVTSSSGSKELIVNEDFVISSSRLTSPQSLIDSELIFVGFGINAPEYNWNDYEGIDVTNKTVVVLVNDPGFYSNDKSFFGGKEMTYYGRWTYKYEEAARQGASGAFIIHNTEMAGYPFHVCKGGRIGPHFVLNSENKTEKKLNIEGWIQQEIAEKVLGFGPYWDLVKLYSTKSSERKNLIDPLKNSKVNVKLENSIEEMTSNNFVAILPGKDSHKDEYVVISAHWDHFGKRKDTSEIMYGARDNALSVSAVIEIARQLSSSATTENKKIRRSVIFFISTAEEQGLLGAKYFAEKFNEIYGNIKKISACLNMDMLNIFGKTRDIAWYGKGKSNLDEITERIAKIKQNRVCSDDPCPENGLFYRSDHFEFAKKGVPGLFIAMGFDHIEKGKEWMVKKSDEWTKECYHKTKDAVVLDADSEWKWDLTGAVDDVMLLVYICAELMESETMPQWYEKAEFSRGK